MLRHFLLCLLTASLFSCGTENPEKSGETVSKSEYQIVITGDHERVLVGDNVESSQWIPEDGWVYLSADEFNEPLGTLTMSIGWKTEEEAYPEYYVASALLSKSDLKVGTAEELNARLYEMTEGTITYAEFGANFIRGHLSLKMERVLNWPDDEPETVIVNGSFTAKSR